MALVGSGLVTLDGGCSATFVAERSTLGNSSLEDLGHGGKGLLSGTPLNELGNSD